MVALVAVALAASTLSSPLNASAPWWERITTIVDEGGATQSCDYQSSIQPSPSDGCDAPDLVPSKASKADSNAGVYSKLTFERRFSPGPRPDSGRVMPGDKLLARQVMFLTIDPLGEVLTCRVVGRSGEMRLAYGCEEAKAERFQAGVGAATGPARQAFMTILVYGHKAQIV